MLISKQTSGTELTIALDGRLDTTTAPELEDELRESIKDIKELVFDMTKLAYIS